MAGGIRHSGETVDQRMDRNWQELLQELRVTQTGVQVLTGFLLTIPFSSAFGDLSYERRVFYMCIVGSAVVSTALLVSPVAFHRVLFRRGERAWLVKASARSASAGVAALGVTLVGVVWLLCDVAIGTTAATVAASLATALFLLLWLVVPLVARRT